LPLVVCPSMLDALRQWKAETAAFPPVPGFDYQPGRRVDHPWVLEAAYVHKTQIGTSKFDVCAPSNCRVQACQRATGALRQFQLKAHRPFEMDWTPIL
jgi:hypothetical protein